MPGAGRSDGRRDGRRDEWQGSGAVAAVAFAAGLLFATNASLFAAEGQRTPTNLTELARSETERLEAQEAVVKIAV